MKKRIIILEATGSIGRQTLDVARRLPDYLSVVGLSAGRNISLLQEQAAEFGVPAEMVEHGERPNLTRLATSPGVDIVVVAVAGAAGVEATLAALEAGIDVALATKEVLVAAGALAVTAAERSGAKILPIDSEHSAIFQCLQGHRTEDVSALWLTASGGAFRDWPLERLAKATPAEALKHPTWPTMGRKITVDSATLMNKALEIIEARWLFGVHADKVGVLIHPQSVVHSMVEFCDGSLLAQLGRPDMRLPIQYALLFPTRLDAGLPRLNLVNNAMPLTFAEPDQARFPSLDLARHVLSVGGTAPAVLNAANEAAVGLFLDERIPFLAIVDLVERVVAIHQPIPEPGLPDILRADQWARRAVAECVETESLDKA